MDLAELALIAAAASLPAGIVTQAVKLAARRIERRMGPWWDWSLRTVSACLGAGAVAVAVALPEPWRLDVASVPWAVVAGFAGGLFATTIHAAIRRLIRQWRGPVESSPETPTYEPGEVEP